MLIDAFTEQLFDYEDETSAVVDEMAQWVSDRFALHDAAQQSVVEAALSIANNQNNVW